jgi:8-oxo-dGTP pyrophosphatase MutT (NUDIX family)
MAVFAEPINDYEEQLTLKTAADLGLNKTVKVVIFHQGKVLLVHELGKSNRKPPGWGLPGGGIFPDPTAKFDSVSRLREEIISEIRERLNKAKIDLSKEVPDTEMDRGNDFEDIVYLTAIKEVLEETHVFAMPRRIMFTYPKGDSGYENVYVNSVYIDGAIAKNTSETDDCDFFLPGNLPEGLYLSHATAIERAAVEMLGINSGDVRIGESPDPDKNKTVKQYQEERVFLRERKRV